MDNGLFSNAKVACLINPKAANSKWMRRPRLRKLFLELLSCEVYDAFGDPHTTTDKAREACRNCRIIVAMGGDGTVADAIQGVVESGRIDETSFTVLPFGSGNAFRKSFGIPRSPRRAVRLLKHGVVKKIDLLETGGRYAAFSSIGATALITGEKLKNKIHGFWGHILAAKYLHSAGRAEKVLVLEDGLDKNGHFETKTVRSRFLDCIISKTNYFGYSWLTAPNAVVDDGYLDVNLFEMTPAAYILFFPLIYSGIYQRAFGRHFKAKRITISGKDIHTQINGEYLGAQDEVRFRSVPQALKMIVPATKAGSKHFVSRS